MVDRRDAAPTAWTVSLSRAPRRVVARHFFAIWSYPLSLSVVLGRHGWFRSDDGRTVAMLRRQPPSEWTAPIVVLIVVVASQVVMRVVAAVVGPTVVMLVMVVLLIYLAIAGVGRWWHGRELTTRAERRGLFRLGGVPRAGWTLTVDCRPPGTPPWDAVDGLLSARVPPSDSVGTEARSESAQRELEQIGFATTRGEKGHMERVQPAPE
ncbi:hypothetical protein IF650_01575 [Cellulosimicrobium terreum]|nr:hypothetical protein [Cellulosimicrobium terreum]